MSAGKVRLAMTVASIHWLAYTRPCVHCGGGSNMPEDLEAAVEFIKSDRENGARELALVALRAFSDVAANENLEQAKAAAQELALARPMMTAIGNAIAAGWAAYEDTGGELSSLDEIIHQLKDSPRQMVALNKIPKGTIMTYSYSSTVLEVLAKLRPTRVIISEGRPLKEGIKAARRLVGEGISITLITEAQMALFVQEVEAVVVGADTIFPDGSYVNKIGTRLLALAAQAAEVPLYVLAETLKVSARSSPARFIAEEGKRKEVAREKWLQVRNVYFEVTPAQLVTSYLTNEGVIRPQELHRFGEKAEQERKRLFGG